MNIGKIMTANIASVNRETTLAEAANLMKEHNIGSIPVCDGNKIVGIVTDRDIVLRGIAEGNELTSITCGKVMSPDLALGTIDMDVRVAAEIMANRQIRRLPVVDNGRLVGMVSLGDLATEPKLTNEAGDALNDISKPSRPII